MQKIVDGELIDMTPEEIEAFLEDQTPAPIPARRQFSFLEFMDLFTNEEQLVLVEASMASPAIKLWYDKAVGAQYIDLDDGRTVDGLQALIDANLLDADRVTAVLSGEAPS